MRQNSRGASLIEVLIMAGVIGVVAMGTAGMMLSIQKETTRLSVKLVAADLRGKIISTIHNSQAWSNTINHGSNSGAFGCITGGTSCAGFIANPAPFTLVNADNEEFIINEPSAGFSPTGDPCDSYSANSGDDACPLKVELTWEPVCPPAPTICNDPFITVKGRFFYNPSGFTRSGSINMTAYDFSISRENEVLFSQDIVVVDQRPAGTVGGACSPNDWVDRQLNVTLFDPGQNVVSLASPVLTLRPGTYNCVASAPAYGVMGHVIRIVNLNTGGNYYGTTEFSDGLYTTRSVWSGLLYSSVNLSIKIQHLCWSGSGVEDFGAPAAAGYAPNEVYTILRCRKIN